MYTEIRFMLNGEQKVYTGDPLRRLLDVLRDDYGMTGSKEGCGEGECGACSVIKDGKLVDTKKYRGQMAKVATQLIRDYAESYHMDRQCLWLVYTVGLSDEVRKAAEQAATAANVNRIMSADLLAFTKTTNWRTVYHMQSLWTTENANAG